MKMSYRQTTLNRHRIQWYQYQSIDNRVTTTFMECQINISRTVEVMSLKPLLAHKWCANAVKLKLWHVLLEHRHFNKHADLFHVSSLFVKNFDLARILSVEKVKETFWRKQLQSLSRKRHYIHWHILRWRVVETTRRAQEDGVWVWQSAEWSVVQADFQDVYSQG